MEDNKPVVEGGAESRIASLISFDPKEFMAMVVLNWKWLALSAVIALSLGAVYLRYTTPVYTSSGNFLIKDNADEKGARNLSRTTNISVVSSTMGLENEVAILKSHSIAEQVVRDLKLYAAYTVHGKVKDTEVYGSQPVSVDLDPAHLDKLSRPMALNIRREGNGYRVSGSYGTAEEDGPSKSHAIDKVVDKLPATISTSAGIITLAANTSKPMADGQDMDVVLTKPYDAAKRYKAGTQVSNSIKGATILTITQTDELPARACDYIRQLAACYNQKANDDKNEVARRTEAFINSRLEKINDELGSTEGELQSYKERNRLVNLGANASAAMANQNQYEQKLAEANTQVTLMNSIAQYMRDPANKYQTLPSNVGLSDQSATALISRYNDIVLERNRLLRSASESSPTIVPLTAQLDDLSASIDRAMEQARRSFDIQRAGVASQYYKYSGQVGETPEQERMLSQIGRQQDVKSGLYLLLLQKREENSISLAATADKGMLIDDPVVGGKVSPQEGMVMGGALAAGLALPLLVMALIVFTRFKIEGHDDVAKLTKLPIVADIAVANYSAKGKAGIVVQENRNSQMEEIFRSMRTNLQFMLKDGQKVVSFTSTTSGEGKTFCASNVAMSFALLGKKVVLVGLDIRKPRLAELFEVAERQKGITPLLMHDSPSEADLEANLLKSGVSNNLDLLLAGPIPPNPTELMARKSLYKVMDMLRSRYDYVVVDTAPVGLVSDTLQLGRVTDITVYVCRADYTTKDSFDLVNQLCAEGKLPQMCVAINGIDMSKKKYGYYYGYGRYGKYGKRYYGYKSYGHYGQYSNSQYGDKNDTSVKTR